MSRAAYHAHRRATDPVFRNKVNRQAAESIFRRGQVDKGEWFQCWIHWTEKNALSPPKEGDLITFADRTYRITYVAKKVYAKMIDRTLQRYWKVWVDTEEVDETDTKPQYVGERLDIT